MSGLHKNDNQQRTILKQRIRALIVGGLRMFDSSSMHYLDFSFYCRKSYWQYDDENELEKLRKFGCYQTWSCSRGLAQRHVRPKQPWAKGVGTNYCEDTEWEMCMEKADRG